MGERGTTKSLTSFIYFLLRMYVLLHMLCNRPISALADTDAVEQDCGMLYGV